MDTTLTSGLPAAQTGLATAGGMQVPPPPVQDMIGWRRDGGAARIGDQVWLIGAHGGAGVSTVRRCLQQAGVQAGDAGRAWPEPDGLPVMVVARTHGRGLHSANAAARQHLSGHTPPGTQLFGCILVPDGPGRLSRPMLAEISRQVPGVYPMTFAAPWADEYRMFDPDTSEHWPPLPAEMEQLARRVADLLAAAAESVR
ncbi:MAG TPA: DUF6668 family protein [Jatrophihabitans sp.]|nr:DUF6668 family protein [Jatrophihabitans sp.]